MNYGIMELWSSDWNSLSDYFSCIDWSNEFSFCSRSDDLWNTFYFIVISGINQFVPRNVIKCNSSVKYHSKEVNKLINKRKACGELSG